jgi:hypothetical protein
MKPIKRMVQASFLKKHSQLFSFVSVLIVLMTFVVREELRDYWRQMADSIDRAQYIYSLKSDTTASRQTLERLEERMNMADNLSEEAKRGFVRTKLIAWFRFVTWCRFFVSAFPKAWVVSHFFSRLVPSRAYCS